MIDEISANPTHKIGRFNPDPKRDIKMDFSINTSECKVGQASALKPSMGSDEESMVVHLTDVPKTKEERKLVWESIPQISPTLILCVAKPGMSLSARRMLEDQPIATSFIGNQYAVKIIQVFQPTTIFNLHVVKTQIHGT